MTNTGHNEMTATITALPGVTPRLAPQVRLVLTAQDRDGISYVPVNLAPLTVADAREVARRLMAAADAADAMAQRAQA